MLPKTSTHKQKIDDKKRYFSRMPNLANAAFQQKMNIKILHLITRYIKLKFVCNLEEGKKDPFVEKCAKK